MYSDDDFGIIRNYSSRMDNHLLMLKHNADSWSTSEVRSLVHKHLWTIRGFSQLECRYLETSAKIKDISNSVRLQAPQPSQPSSSAGGGLPELPDITFRIRLHPQGNKESNKDFSFFQVSAIEAPNTNPPYKARFKFTVYNARGEETPTTVYSGTQQLHGYFEYIRREALISHVQPNDDLQLSLSITVTFDTVTKACQNVRAPPPELPKPIEVTKDLEDLLRSGKHADFTLVVDQRELKAHKAILSARSPVFAAMMEPHTVEAQTSRVILKDIDYEVAQFLLCYIYTGGCSNMGHHALDIVAAADRFALPGLKNLAEHAMRNGLAPDTVCKQLAHAELYNMMDFKKEAIKYICLNSHAVVNSEGFVRLSREAPHIMGEIMLTMSTDRLNASPFGLDGSCEPSAKRARMTETNL